MKVLTIAVNTAVTYLLAAPNPTSQVRSVAKMDVQQTTHPILVNDDISHDDAGLLGKAMLLASTEVLKHPNLNTPSISNQVVVFQEVTAIKDAFLNVASYSRITN